MMKNVLKLMLVLATLTTIYASCSKTDMYDRERVEEDARVRYKKHFLEYVGNQIDPDVNWGFGSTVSAVSRKAPLRAATKATVTLDKDYPLVYTANFFEKVRNYFPEGQAPKSDVTSWEFRQHVPFANLALIYSNTTARDEVGLYYYNPATDTPETAEKYVLIDNIQNENGVGRYFQKQTFPGQWANPAADEGYKMWNEGTQRIQTNAFFIKMDTTYNFGVYVKNADTGKTYYTNMNLNADRDAFSGALIGKDDAAINELGHQYIFGLSDDGKPGCELLFVLMKTGEEAWPHPAWPLLLIPEKKLRWDRIIAEDLNVHDAGTDFDFNDIVLDVALTENGDAKCILQAAGATLKIRINGDDNLEVHKMFGVEQPVMVNTKAEQKGMKGATKPPVEFELKGPFASTRDIKIEVYKSGSWLELTAPTGDAACKIAIPDTSFVWPNERESLKKWYPNFIKYVQENQMSDSWWKK